MSTNPRSHSAPILSERMLTVFEAADLLQVNPQSIYRLVRAGKIRAYRPARNFRFCRSDLVAYLQSRETVRGEVAR